MTKLNSVMFPSPFGELYFSINTKYLGGNYYDKFPSPFGELYFSIEIRLQLKHNKYLFPSPIGELYFSIFDTWDSGNEIPVYCFRPLSGSYISQFQTSNKKQYNVVSVPYRGAIFLNRNRNRINRHNRVSVPYRGAIFLNSMGGSKSNEEIWFPSPIGELYFSIYH